MMVLKMCLVAVISMIIILKPMMEEIYTTSASLLNLSRKAVQLSLRMKSIILQKWVEKSLTLFQKAV